VSNLLKKEKGFTLIEIVLVLAIAGLLLVIVFLAVSGAQKARRDSQRKNDGAGFAAALEAYAGNNQGSYPAIGVNPPLNATYWSRKDPTTGNAYIFTNAVNVAPAAGTIGYATNATCNGGVGTGAGSARNYAVVTGLEQGGSICVDNK
jgi:prepilin-type N-terminal cleavage/methylation domain-containing protein